MMDKAKEDATRWLVPGQEVPVSSAARFATATPVPQSYPPAETETPSDPPPVISPAVKTAPAEKKAIAAAKPAPRAAGAVASQASKTAPPVKKSAPRAAGAAGAAGKPEGSQPASAAGTSRKAFMKAYTPRMHKTGPQPALAPYQGDIKKLLKKGYSAADIYHWLHDMRGEAISQRTVQRFVRTLAAKKK